MHIERLQKSRRETDSGMISVADIKMVEIAPSPAEARSRSRFLERQEKARLLRELERRNHLGKM